MSKTPICLTGGSAEDREAFREVLSDGPYSVAGEFDTAAACAKSAGEIDEPEMVLYLADPAGEAVDRNVDVLRRAFPVARLVVHADNPPRERLVACIESGANAFLPKSIGSQALLQALGVVLLGESLFVAGGAAERKRQTPVNRRQAERRRKIQQAEIVFNGSHCVMSGTILDISESGAKIRPADVVNAPSKFELRVKYGPTFLCEVVRRSGLYLGVRFVDQSSA